PEPTGRTGHAQATGPAVCPHHRSHGCLLPLPHTGEYPVTQSCTINKYRKMETRQITPQTRQRRKLLLALPLLALPFAALAFYALGGGKGTPAAETAASGINTALPGATFKKREPMGKMDFYEQARRDFIQAAKED